MGSCPTLWNEETASEAEKSALLWAIRERQGAGVTRMLDAFRTPLGRQVDANFLTQDLSYRCIPGSGTM